MPGQFVISLNGTQGRLVEVGDRKPPSATRAFRVDFDNQFTRVFQVEASPESNTSKGWLALTPDGVRHYFEELGGASDGTTIWNITKQIDPQENTVRYFWKDLRLPRGDQPIDHLIERIEYGANPAAGLKAHAQIEFGYDPVDLCRTALAPIGAAFRPGSTNVTGSGRLSAITTSVRSDSLAPWRSVRTVKREYLVSNALLHIQVPLVGPVDPAPDPEGFRIMDCKRNLVRYLTQVAQSATDRDGVDTNLPAMRFTYHGRLRTTGPLPFGSDPLRVVTLDTIGFAEQGDGTGTRASLHDVDADGLRDRLEVVVRDERCVLLWKKGLPGGSFQNEARAARLPTFDWFHQTEPQGANNVATQKLPTEDCTLNGQIVQREVVVQPGFGNALPASDARRGCMVINS